MINVGDVVGGVGRSVDELGSGGEEQGGFDLAGVEAVGLLLFAEAGKGCARRAEEAKDAKVELGAEIAGHDVDEGGVSAVGVVENEFLETCVTYARAEIMENSHEGGGRDGECAGEADVFVTLAVAQRWECVDRGVGGEFFQGPSE